jgi:ketosteroid isomerase-like protein
MSLVIDGTGLTADDVAAIRGMIEPWIDACVQRDWDRLLAMCTDDIVFLPPNEPPVETARARSWLDNFPTIKAMSIEMEHIEGAGQLACVRGWVKMALEISAQQVAFDGKYIDVFRKQPDGQWRFAQVMWSANKAA